MSRPLWQADHIGGYSAARRLTARAKWGQIVAVYWHLSIFAHLALRHLE